MNFLHLQERVTCLIQVNFYSRIFVVVGFQFLFTNDANHMRHESDEEILHLELMIINY